MAGGLLQIISNNSAENLWINGNPEITLFKKVFRRHTPFSSEFIDKKIAGADFGKKCSVKLDSNGDLIHKMFLAIELPEIRSMFLSKKTDDAKNLLQNNLQQNNLDMDVAKYIADNDCADIPAVIKLLERHLHENISDENLSKDFVNKLQNMSVVGERSIRTEYFPVDIETDHSISRTTIGPSLDRYTNAYFMNMIYDQWFSLPGNSIPIFHVIKSIQDNGINGSMPRIICEKTSDDIINHILSENLLDRRVFSGNDRDSIVISDTLDTINNIYSTLAETVPIIMCRSFRIDDETYDIYSADNGIELDSNGSFTMSDPNYTSRFYSKLSRNNAGKYLDLVLENFHLMIENITCQFEYLIQKYRENLFDKTDNLFYRKSSPPSHIYSYYFPAKPYADNPDYRIHNTFNTNIWYFFFFKYLDEINGDTYSDYISSKNPEIFTRLGAKVLNLLIFHLKTNIEYYMMEYSYVLSDLYKASPSTDTTDTFKNYIPESRIVPNNLFVVTAFYHRSAIPSIADMFQYIYDYVDSIDHEQLESVYDIFQVNFGKISNLELYNIRNSIKKLYEYIYGYFAATFNEMNLGDIQEPDDPTTSMEIGIMRYMKHFLGISKEDGIAQKNIGMFLPQMEFYFASENLNILNQQQFYHDILSNKDYLKSSLDPDIFRIVSEISLETEPYFLDKSNFYQVPTLNRYDGSPFLETPYVSRFYGLAPKDGSEIPDVMDDISSDPFGVNHAFFSNIPDINNIISVNWNSDNAHHNAIRASKIGIDYYGIKHEIFQDSHTSFVTLHDDIPALLDIIDMVLKGSKSADILKLAALVPNIDVDDISSSKGVAHLIDKLPHITTDQLEEITKLSKFSKPITTKVRILKTRYLMSKIFWHQNNGMANLRSMVEPYMKSTIFSDQFHEYIDNILGSILSIKNILVEFDLVELSLEILSGMDSNNTMSNPENIFVERMSEKTSLTNVFKLLKLYLRKIPPEHFHVIRKIIHSNPDFTDWDYRHHNHVVGSENFIDSFMTELFLETFGRNNKDELRIILDKINLDKIIGTDLPIVDKYADMINEVNNVIKNISEYSKIYFHVEGRIESIKKIIHKLKLIISRPDHPDNAWIKRLGYYMIEYVELERNGRTINRMSSELLDIRSRLFEGDNVGINKLIGNITELNKYNGSCKKPYLLRIPLSFYFHDYSSHSLPIVSDTSGDYRINLKFRNISDCLYQSEFASFVNKNGRVIMPELGKVELSVEYIYLSEQERSIFMSKNLEYFTDEYQYQNNIVPSVENITSCVLSSQSAYMKHKDRNGFESLVLAYDDVDIPNYGVDVRLTFANPLRTIFTMIRPVSHIESDRVDYDKSLNYFHGEKQWSNYGVNSFYDLRGFYRNIDKIASDISRKLHDISDPDFGLLRVFNRILADDSQTHPQAILVIVQELKNILMQNRRIRMISESFVIINRILFELDIDYPINIPKILSAIIVPKLGEPTNDDNRKKTARTKAEYIQHMKNIYRDSLSRLLNSPQEFDDVVEYAYSMHKQIIAQKIAEFSQKIRFHASPDMLNNLKRLAFMAISVSPDIAKLLNMAIMQIESRSMVDLIDKIKIRNVRQSCLIYSIISAKNGVCPIPVSIIDQVARLIATYQNNIFDDYFTQKFNPSDYVEDNTFNDPAISSNLVLNNIVLEEKLSDSVFRSSVVPYLYSKYSADGVGMYSWSLDPSSPTPNGSLNASRIPIVDNGLILDSKINTHNPAELINIATSVGMYRYVAGGFYKAW